MIRRLRMGGSVASVKWMRAASVGVGCETHLETDLERLRLVACPWLRAVPWPWLRAVP